MTSLFHRSYKNVYPFRLGTTSFILRDDYVPNVSQLSPFLDEIELLVFESHAAGIPSADTVRALARIGKQSPVCYNVHLPIDVNLAAPTPGERQWACDRLLQVMERLSPLFPTTWTLHLDGTEYQNPDLINQWQDQADRGLKLLVEAGIDLTTVSLENLFYPVSYWHPLLEKYPVRICLDIGHAILTGQSPANLFCNWAERISILHMHGVSEGQDHLPLSRLPDIEAKPMMQFLRSFHGSVSLEVFSLPFLIDSLIWLEEAFFNVHPDCYSFRPAIQSSFDRRN